MIKSRGRNGRALVTFTLSPAVGASDVAICGEWNDWSADRDVMERGEDGFAHTVELEAGRSYRFRYLLDGHRWENDWAADSYVPNDHGSDDSVVDLSAVPEEATVVSTNAGVQTRAEKPAATKPTRAKKSGSIGTAKTTEKKGVNQSQAVKKAAAQRPTNKPTG
jgi:hypothetical protein